MAAPPPRDLKGHDPSLDVTLLDPAPRFVTCPFSNLVLGGLRDIASIAARRVPMSASA